MSQSPYYDQSPRRADSESRRILSAADIDRALTRIAHEILESHRGAQDVVLLGIARRGYPLAQRLASKLSQFDAFDPATSLGQLDVTMYRDDLWRQPSRVPSPTLMPQRGVDNLTVVLVDDVLYSGRTIRAALDALTELGRPAVVRLAVLVDRGHRQLPIRADFVGKNVPTATREMVKVRLQELDALDTTHTDEGSVDEVVILG
ncbi:MAG: bifunctional pyr operon transcriptional regulator/uracil phosphoribosyltransferase PyrR [Kocuria sp.]|nr:bifunctional pyr operon transcriptional regulator/uracil phosphoribosyltransferase PyrR [Kocuria sp.]